MNNLKLIIVESPTKARTLSRFLGDGYRIEATMGHIRDLPQRTLGVDIEKDFKPKYEIPDKQKKTVEKLRESTENATDIILATDPDREGEAIAWHTAHVIRSQKRQETRDKRQEFKRIVFHEITKSAIEEALKNPRTVDMHLVDAQQARRVLDRLMGYQLSPLLWSKTGKRWLSAGRVQSVAVRLIVERERAIQAFIPTEYWELIARLKPKTSSDSTSAFSAKLLKIGDKKAEISKQKEMDSHVAVLKKASYSIVSLKQDNQERRAFPPFITSTLQRSCANVFGWPARKTMTLAQNLYEEGLITYHRTDSVTLSAQAFAMARDYIKTTFGNEFLPETPMQYKTKSKVAQEAHEAIRPTSLAKINLKDHSAGKIDLGSNKLGYDHQKLFDLIARRFISSQMKPQIVERTVIDVQAIPSTSHPDIISYLFRAIGEREVFKGWRILFKNPMLKAPVLPNLIEKALLDLLSLNPEQKFTQPPARYNEASLIKALEEQGIGRPSTYAPIIHTIQLRQYVEKDENRSFAPTELGIAVNDFLVDQFGDMINIEFTSGLESDLDKIANGELSWVERIRDFWHILDTDIIKARKTVTKIVIEQKKTGEKCPECGKDLVERIGRYGKFLACSGFPKCRFTKPIIVTIDIPCPKCGGKIVLKQTKKRRKFYGCSNYPTCNFASWRKPKV